MAGLTRFDFLREPVDPALARILELRVPERAIPPVIALAVALLVVAVAVPTEHARVAAARADVRSADLARDDVRAQLAQRKIDGDRVRSLLAADRQLREVRESGYRAARVLADLSVQVPSGVWIDAIRPSVKGYDADANALKLSAVARAVRTMSGRHARAQLRRLARVENAGGFARFAFTLHVEPR